MCSPRGLQKRKDLPNRTSGLQNAVPGPENEPLGLESVNLGDCK